MPDSHPHRPVRTRRRVSNRVRLIAGLTTVAATAIAVAIVAPANATTTVTGTGPGGVGGLPYTRQPAVTITVNPGAYAYSRTGTGNYSAALSPTAAAAVCAGDNTAAGGVDNTPYQTVTVTGPGGQVYTGTSPARQTGLLYALANPPYPVISPPPAASNTAYLGGVIAIGSSHPAQGWTVNLDLTGDPGGVYSVVTTTDNEVGNRTASNKPYLCAVGTPNSTTTYTAGSTTDTQQFEYRPWQDTFTDVFGGGKVYANFSPSEFQWSIGSAISNIYEGADGGQQFYSLPLGTPFVLPTDPSTCLSDPAACLPPTAQRCLPNTGCTPRIMLLGKAGTNESIFGAFDLLTKAYIATTSTGGNERTQLSLGTTNDAAYHALLTQLETYATAHNIPLAQLLAMSVNLTLNGKTLTVSLLDGLQISPSDAVNGLVITNTPGVVAGVILNAVIGLAPTTTSCLSHSATSSSTPPGTSFTSSSGAGLTVQEANLPAIPSVNPALGAIAGGPIWHITGNTRSVAGENLLEAEIGAGVDLTGTLGTPYPAYVVPFLNPAVAIAPYNSDFLGVGTWTASEAPFTASSCLLEEGYLGTGIALYNNPLPVGFGTLLSPLFKPNANTAKLYAEIETAVNKVTTQISSNPTVSAVLGDILTELGI